MGIEIETYQYNIEEIPINAREEDKRAVREFIKRGEKLEGRIRMTTTMVDGQPSVSTMEFFACGSKKQLEELIAIIKASSEGIQN